jgi:SAM-dependent methyltransferase
MAPELALRRLRRNPRKVVLDPMMGSGTIPVLAAHRGHHAIGFDIDPLALLIARTWGRPLETKRYLAAAANVAAEARESAKAPFTPSDRETAAFIDYWFDERANIKLAALAAAIRRRRAYRDALWCAFSRLIITKDASVSRARDVSHSRPHRVRDIADVDPIERFPVAARDVARRHAALGPSRPLLDNLRLEDGDARQLPLDDRTVDLTMTSPPYLTAIDYLRGHRLSLVWMGWTLPDLRKLRSEAIGTERGIWDDAELDETLTGVFLSPPTDRARAVLRRYAHDLNAVFAEQARVLRPDGQLTLVVADGRLLGTQVRVARLVARTARRHGFRLTSRRMRDLPADRRYLPPPLNDTAQSLNRRMRTEAALTFRRD